MTTHLMFDGRLQVYRRGDGKVWQCAARVGEQRFRNSTKEENLDQARDVAEEWYLDLRGKLRGGQLITKKERTFDEAYDHYIRQVRVLAATTRSPQYVKNLELQVKAHILPYFGKMALSEINRGTVQSYRVSRAEETIAKTTTADKAGKPPARSTMLSEISYIRQVLKHAEGMGWLAYVPSLQMPYMTSGKREHRAWFSPEEYKKLYAATARRIEEGTRPGWKSHYEDLHDYVLFMANTGLRPDEAKRLEFRDIAIEYDGVTRDDILVIDVRGKTGVGFAKSMPGAVLPFHRLKARREAELANPKKKGVAPRPLDPTDKLFRKFQRDAFNNILREENLKFDRNGHVRTAYSLRHTYISMRLMAGADVYQIANNCRTSVEMIQNFYAAHIKDRIDTRSINMERPEPARPAKKRARVVKKAQSQEGHTASP